MRASAILPVLLLLVLVGCSESYGDRVGSAQEEALTYFCPCWVTAGNYATEAECEARVGALASDYRDCITPVYDDASAVDQAALDCALDKSEETIACVFQSTCDDEANLSRCSEMDVYAECGDIQSEATQNAITVCVDLFADL